jgi:hypothetical protein
VSNQQRAVNNEQRTTWEYKLEQLLGINVIRTGECFRHVVVQRPPHLPNEATFPLLLKTLGTPSTKRTNHLQTFDLSSQKLLTDHCSLIIASLLCVLSGHSSASSAIKKSGQALEQTHKPSSNIRPVEPDIAH